MHEERTVLRIVFALLCAFFVVFVVQPLTYAADLGNLPASTRAEIAPATVDWGELSAQLGQWSALVPDPVVWPGPAGGLTALVPEPVTLGALDWAAGLDEVSIASLWPVYFIESAKAGKLQAGDLAKVIAEGRWTGEDVAAFWARLDGGTADRARRPDVAGEVLAAIEHTSHLQDAFTEDASVEALFGLAQVKLYARKLPDARALLKQVLSRLDSGELPAGSLGKGLVAYRMAESYLFADEPEAALEWFLRPGEWGAPTRAGEYDVRGEAWVEAARVCRRLGLEQEALTHYERALGATGWGAVVAALDRSEQLASEGRFSDAIALLAPLTTGEQGPIGASYGLLFTASCYRRQGDAGGAGRYAQFAIVEASRMGDSAVSLHGAAVVEQARELLASLTNDDPRSVEGGPNGGWTDRTAAREGNGR